MEANCFSCNYVQDPPHLILDADNWKLYLDVNQAYIGESYLALKNHKSSLSDLSKEDWEEYEELVRKIESTYKEVLGVTLFNWSCFMNNSFLEGSTPHVHWHITPRYQNGVELNGHTYKDELFGEHKDIVLKRALSDKDMEMLTTQFRSVLS